MYGGNNQFLLFVPYRTNPADCTGYIMDRRQKKSRKAIFSAFSRLLEDKSYSRITVQEIIDGADVGRSTFYSHFPTKDDLLSELCREMFDHVFSPSLEKETTHDFSGEEGDTEKELVHMLYHIRENDTPRILKGESGVLFFRYFRSRIAPFLKEIICIDDILDIPEDYIINQLSGSLVSTIEWWLSEDPRSSPEEIAKYYLAANSAVIKK